MATRFEYFEKPKSKTVVTMSLKNETIEKLRKESKRLSRQVGRPVYISGLVDYLVQEHFGKAKK